jgi:hypothetical protein
VGRRVTIIWVKGTQSSTDKRLIEASARGTDWRNPARRHADGSVAAEFEDVTRMRHARR